jgi:metal-responsive CopG/Arc/MetJ family transcriptional regulator
LKNQKPILLNLNTAVVERLDNLRWKMKLSRTELIRKAIIEYLNKPQEPAE